MKCPNCGYNLPYTSVNEGNRFRDAVYKRLEEYGFPDKMNPQKYQAYVAIRAIISIRFGFKFKAGGSMTTCQADRALSALDEVLPRKEDKLNDT